MGNPAHIFMLNGSIHLPVPFGLDVLTPFSLKNQAICKWTLQSSGGLD